MVPAKLLVGGTVAVGSTATAAVMAHQYGFFSTTSQSQEAGNVDDAGTTVPENTPVATKSKKDEIKEWLKANQEITNLTIKVTKGGNPKNFDEQDITEEELDRLPAYLTKNAPLLKKLASGTNPTLTFTKDGDSWKYLLTKDLIDAWVSKTSGSKAILKLRVGDTDTALESLSSEFEAIFECFKTNETTFSSLSSLNENKTLVFEKDGSWKHIKKAIKDWLSSTDGGGDKFSITVRDGNTDIDGTDNNNLIGLLKYLKENRETLTNLIKDKNPTSLSFKKEGDSNWEVIYSEETINNWIKNKHSGTQTSLELYEAGTKKTPTENEWKEFFNSIKGEATLFSSSTGKIIFEKDSNTWKHIKKALTDLLTTTKKKSNLTIKISKSGTPTELSDVSDEDLVGLYKYINEDSTDLNATENISFLVFKKDGGTWSRDKTLEKNK